MTESMISAGLLGFGTVWGYNLASHFWRWPMSNLPQEQFNQLFATYGNQLCNDPQRCEALLRDTFPGHTREVSLLVNALKQGIPQELLASQGKVPMEVSRSRLTRKLIDNLFMQEEAAQWVIDAWSAALGLRLAAPPPNPSSPPTTIQAPVFGQDSSGQNPTVINPGSVSPAQPAYNPSPAQPAYTPPAYGYGDNYGSNTPPLQAGNVAPVMAIPQGTPSVWTWYIVYCVAMALVYACLILLGLVIVTFPSSDGLSEAERNVAAGVYIVLGLVFGGIYAVAPFLPKRPWAWIYHIVLICLSFTSCCCIPFGIPLLVFWLRPETRVFFNMPVAGLPTNPN